MFYVLSGMGSKGGLNFKQLLQKKLSLLFRTYQLKIKLLTLKQRYIIFHR